MSHHLDSALSRKDVRLNITDLYVFRGQTGTVFVLDVNTSAAGDTAHTGFHPEARYELKVDTDGDAIEDVTHRFTFGEPDALGRQALELRRLIGPDARRDDATGELVASGVTDADVYGEGGLRLWAGRAAEPFYIDKTVLETAGAAFKSGTRVDLSRWQAGSATNLFKGTDIYAIVLEVPDEQTHGLLAHGRSIGVWGVTKLATDAGGWRRINRAGRPMIQPIFNSDGSEPGSIFNTTAPADDLDNYLERFTNLIAAVVAAHGTADDAHTFAERVAHQLLPDVLPYRVGSSATFGFAGHNGRGLADNAPEVMFSLVTNSAVSVGLDRRSTTATPREAFPYVGALVVERVSAGALA